MRRKYDGTRTNTAKEKAKEMKMARKVKYKGQGRYYENR